MNGNGCGVDPDDLANTVVRELERVGAVTAAQIEHSLSSEAVGRRDGVADSSVGELRGKPLGGVRIRAGPLHVVVELVHVLLRVRCLIFHLGAVSVLARADEGSAPIVARSRSLTVARGSVTVAGPAVPAWGRRRWTLGSRCRLLSFAFVFAGRLAARHSSVVSRPHIRRIEW